MWSPTDLQLIEARPYRISGSPLISEKRDWKGHGFVEQKVGVLGGELSRGQGKKLERTDILNLGELAESVSSSVACWDRVVLPVGHLDRLV